MDLFLVRHAESDHSPRWRNDEIRPLSDLGVEQQTIASKTLREEGFEFDEAWVSPMLRAKQTLEIIEKQCNINLPKREFENLKVWGDHKKVYELILQECEKHPNKRLLVVGHNPNISKLLHLLIPPYNILMNTSEVAWIIIREGISKIKKYYYKEDLI